MTQANPSALQAPLFETRANDRRFGRIIDLGRLRGSRSFDSGVRRNRPTTYQFRLTSRERVNFTLRNDRELEFLNLNLDGSNNIKVDLFRNGGSRNRVFEVEPQDRRSRTFSLRSGTYRLRLTHGGTRRENTLDYRLRIRRNSNSLFF